MDSYEDKYQRIEEFEELLNEIYEEIPQVFFEDLNLGVVIEEKLMLHPQALNDDLYILGTYNKGLLGRGISIYYGSFMKMYGYESRENLKKRLRSTLLHELTHHRENLAKIRDLEVEDDLYLEEYRRDRE